MHADNVRSYRRLIDADDETPIDVCFDRYVDRYVEPYRCLGKISHLTPQDIWQDNTQVILLILLQDISFDPSRYRGVIIMCDNRLFVWIIQDPTGAYSDSEYRGVQEESQGVDNESFAAGSS
jgi:hypothetical protein